MMRIIRDKPGWCDDGGTRQTETCEDQIALALDRALDWIARRQGPDIDKWQWGQEHFAAHRHPLFDGVPLLRDLASVRFPSDGGAQTLNRAQPSYRGSRPFDAVHGAGYRGVYDFSDLDNSRFAMPLGQSGNMLSPLGAQLRRALADAGLRRDRRHPRRGRPHRRRHDRPVAAARAVIQAH